MLQCMYTLYNLQIRPNTSISSNLYPFSTVEASKIPFFPIFWNVQYCYCHEVGVLSPALQREKRGWGWGCDLGMPHRWVLGPGEAWLLLPRSGPEALWGTGRLRPGTLNDG
jgi:hypothetical protein